MKKIYINPSLEVVKIAATHQMLAGSNPEDGFSQSGAEKLESTISSGNMGRRGWFDDSDDE
ncbi:MAG: hypothetical protein IJ144_01475 [Prevotella sp.]|nr:hypothetical protein [Prevotella sp.]